ncbi:MAG: 5-methylcytosine-specific restriction endonuclease system specificity protein McrC [Fusobacterium sp.]
MIKIQNIYYMLTYAFQILKEQGYANCATEEFENTADLLSAILVKGVTVQIKRGLNRTYVEKTESLSCLRGKINVTESIRQQTIIKQQLVCTYDEFSPDPYMNRILKTTMELLLRYDIPKIRKKELRNLLLYFKDIKTLDIYNINWKFRFHRNNQSYQMLMSVCHLILKGLLQTTADGSVKLMHFLDEQRMCRLYEKFILEYYKKEHPEIKASASQISWQLDDEFSSMLPIMQTDIMLSKENTTLIIDAKYYTHTTQTQYSSNTLHSGNLYQIFTYVKNKDAEYGEVPHTVSGMLLYAKTDEVIQPNQIYHMSGNKISVRTLDLNQPFKEIANQLDNIVKEHFLK